MSRVQSDLQVRFFEEVCPIFGGVVLANSGIDIGLHEGEGRMWQRFFLGVKFFSVADSILVEACC